MKSLVLFLIFSFISIFYITAKFATVETIYAQTNYNSQYEKVNPDNETKYKLKRFGEKVNIIILNLFNKQEVGKYELKLLRRRAFELVYVSDNKQISLIETTVSRYITQTGFVKEQFEAKKIDAGEIQEVLSGLHNKFEELRDNNPAQSANWLLLQQAADSTEVLENEIHAK